MTNKFLKILTLSALLSIGFIQTIEAKNFSKLDINKMCSQKSSIPKAGLQFDGKIAINTIMKLKAGKYTYPKGMLLLYANNYYLLQVPKTRNSLHGTDANDLMGAGGILGGCSKEQLSEAIQNNGLSANKFKLIKKYR